MQNQVSVMSASLLRLVFFFPRTSTKRCFSKQKILGSTFKTCSGKKIIFCEKRWRITFDRDRHHRTIFETHKNANTGLKIAAQRMSEDYIYLQILRLSPGFELFEGFMGNIFLTPKKFFVFNVFGSFSVRLKGVN